MVRHPSSERNDALAHATRWLNLEIISLSEKSQTREATRPLDPFMRTAPARDRRVRREEADYWPPEAAGGRDQGGDSQVAQVLFSGDKKVLKLTRAVVAHICATLKTNDL